jgi:N-acetylmuramoyl-L-alanine amidase
VLVAKHKHRDVEQGWKIYSAEQLEAAVQLGSLLVQTYGIREVVGHEDIAPGRKSDPGPAFPMERYRGLLLGRSTDDVG